MSRLPVVDALHRHLFARNDIALDQRASDRAIGIAIVGIVVDAQRGAVLKNHPRRALDLNGERLERVPEPADFKLLTIERAGFDSAAVVVRDDLIFLVAFSDQRPFVRKWTRSRLMASGNEIGRPPVERDMEFR